MSLKGIEGAEELSKHLNNYLAQMIKRISKNGGDICKFAGDAIIVLWPLEETMDIRLVIYNERFYKKSLFPSVLFIN